MGDLLQSAGPDAVSTPLDFCTCWKVRPSPSASFCWLIESIIRRMRTRLPTCLSVGFGAFFASVAMGLFPLFSPMPTDSKSVTIETASLIAGPGAGGFLTQRAHSPTERTHNLLALVAVQGG